MTKATKDCMRFYFDYGNEAAKSRGGDAPNALAIDVASHSCFTERGEDSFEGLSSLFEAANSAVAVGSVSGSYLRECCRRVSRSEAFRVHPQLAAGM